MQTWAITIDGKVLGYVSAHSKRGAWARVSHSSKYARWNCDRLILQQCKQNDKREPK